MSIPGIYLIQNKVTKKRYVGKTVNTERRFQQHIKLLKKRKHHNKLMQKEADEYGTGCFSFYVLEITCREELNKREAYWIQQIKPEYTLDEGIIKRWKEGMETYFERRWSRKIEVKAPKKY